MRNIHKSTPPSFRRRENAAAIVKATPPGALTKGPDRKFPGLHPPLGGATSPSLSTNRRFAFPILAFLAVLAVALLFLLPGGLLQAQETSSKTVEYTENDTSPVLTLSARDPEDAAPIVWSLPPADADPDGTDNPLMAADVADNASFKISQSGVLTFDMKPSFEDSSASGDDDSYKVVVQASDGNMSSYFKVTVNVQDEEEEGSVKLSPTGQLAATLLQPQVDVGITAHSLTDPDGRSGTRTDDDIVEADATWQWYRSSSKTAMGTMIAGETNAPYTPVT